MWSVCGESRDYDEYFSEHWSYELYIAVPWLFLVLIKCLYSTPTTALQLGRAMSLEFLKLHICRVMGGWSNMEDIDICCCRKLISWQEQCQLTEFSCCFRILGGEVWEWPNRRRIQIINRLCVHKESGSWNLRCKCLKSKICLLILRPLKSSISAWVL